MVPYICGVITYVEELKEYTLTQKYSPTHTEHIDYLLNGILSQLLQID